MISLIIIWLYIALVVVVYGIIAVKFLKYLFDIDNDEYPPLAIIFILGLCLVTTLAGYLSLFINLGFWAFALVSAIAVLTIYLYFKEIYRLIKDYFYKLYYLNKFILIIFSLSIIFILIKSTSEPSSFDTGLYHAQAIRWIEEYRVVPGLGNLHGRLAFNFSWFLPSALFGFSFLKIQPFHFLNPLFLLLVIAMSFNGANELLKGNISFSHIMRVSIILPILFVFKDQLSSPNVEIPATLLICVTFIYYVTAMENKLKINYDDMKFSIITILSVYMVTVKLSTLPIMIFVIFIIGKRLIERRIKETLLLLIIALVIITPQIIRNIILSGYLIYPLPGVDMFNFDWKVPIKSVINEIQAIKNYARNPGLISDNLLDKGIIYWFPSWLTYVTTAYRKKLEIIFLPSIIIFCGIIINIIKDKGLKINYNIVWENRIVYLTAFMGGIFWFVTAPDLRLGYGFIIITSIIIFMPIMNVYRPMAIKTIVLLTCSFVLYFEIVYVGSDIFSLKNRLVWPGAYPKVSLNIIHVGDKVIYSPGGKGQCWYAPLPCAPGPVPKLEFRGDKLPDGFRRKAE